MRRVLLFLGLALLVSSRTEAAEIHVSAAASLSNALGEIARNYARNGGATVIFNFGSSGILARQIEEEAPADLFISADEATMDALQRKGLIDTKSRVSLLSNALVIVVPAEGGPKILSPSQLADPSISRIAIGDPATVPAGKYARQYLQKIGIWTRVESKVIPMETVRAALAAVESGDADAGIVYRTDANITKRVRIAFEVAHGQGPAISYPIALVSHAQSRDAGRRFLTFLQSKAALDVFRRYGFIVP